MIHFSARHQHYCKRVQILQMSHIPKHEPVYCMCYYSNRITIAPSIRLLREALETLASWKYITIELEDGLPAALRNVYGPNQDDLFFRDPSTADSPIWILTGKPMGFLQTRKILLASMAC